MFSQTPPVASLRMSVLSVFGMLSLFVTPAPTMAAGILTIVDITAPNIVGAPKDGAKKGKRIHVLQSKGVEPFGVHGRVSETVQNGRPILFGDYNLQF